MSPQVVELTGAVLQAQSELERDRGTLIWSDVLEHADSWHALCVLVGLDAATQLVAERRAA